MKPINEMDRAQLKQEFKNLYLEVGEMECYQVLYELCVSAEILAEVLNDKAKERNLDGD
jgi:hypothetical protein